MNHLATIAIEPPGEPVQMAFLASLMEGQGPNAAARAAGTNLISLYMARCASPAFDELWHFAELARRDEIIHSTLRKAMVATGTVVEMELRSPDNGEVLLDDNFEPLKAERLVNGNAAILSTLLTKVLQSADRPNGPSTLVQVNNTNNVGNDLPARPRLINPMEEPDG
jgi:hypothetical protein